MEGWTTGGGNGNEVPRACPPGDDGHGFADRRVAVPPGDLAGRVPGPVRGDGDRREQGDVHRGPRGSVSCRGGRGDVRGPPPESKPPGPVLRHRRGEVPPEDVLLLRLREQRSGVRANGGRDPVRDRGGAEAEAVPGDPVAVLRPEDLRPRDRDGPGGEQGRRAVRGVRRGHTAEGGVTEGPPTRFSRE